MAVQISAAKLIPLLTKLGSYFTQGLDYYILLRAAGKDAGPDMVTSFIVDKMKDWNPEVLGKHVLDRETKHAAARMLAGVVVNLSVE
jgi:hypothetical protein